MRRFGVLMGFTLVLLGCGPPPKDPAVVAFDQLFRALVRGEAEQAYDLLGPESRAALARGVGEGGDADRSDVTALLAIRPGWTFVADRVRKARLDPSRSGGERRMVVGPLAGGTWAVPVVKVGNAWRVELVEARPVPDGETTGGG